MDFSGDVLADHGNLPDQPAQFHFDTLHPHVASQINNVFCVIIYAFAHTFTSTSFIAPARQDFFQGTFQFYKRVGFDHCPDKAIFPVFFNDRIIHIAAGNHGFHFRMDFFPPADRDFSSLIAAHGGLADGIVAAGTGAVGIDGAALGSDEGALVVGLGGHAEHHQGQAGFFIKFRARIDLEEFSGGYPQTLFEADNVVGSEGNINTAATFRETGNPGVAFGNLNRLSLRPNLTVLTSFILFIVTTPEKMGQPA